MATNANHVLVVVLFTHIRNVLLIIKHAIVAIRSFSRKCTSHLLKVSDSKDDSIPQIPSQSDDQVFYQEEDLMIKTLWQNQEIEISHVNHIAELQRVISSQEQS